MRIAIIRLSALGDIINSLFILHYIKAKYPDASIDWICEEAFASLLEHHPLINTVHAVAIKRAKLERSPALLIQTIRQLKSLGPYDSIIDLQGLLKSAIVARIIGSHVHGFDKESLREGMAAWFYSSHSHIPYRENAIVRTAKIVSDALDLEITPEKLLDKPPAFTKDRLPIPLQTLVNPDQKNIIFTLGSSWPSKVYPKTLFLQTANLLKANIILVWGSEQEHEDARFIAKDCSHCQIAPKLSLYDLLQLITHADLTIGNDSGPTHMAWMQNRPSITLFGPTPASKMMFATPISLAIESDSEIDPLKLNREDYSIQTISPASIVEQADYLLR